MIMNTAPEPAPRTFSGGRILDDVETSKYNGRMQTRLPACFAQWLPAQRPGQGLSASISASPNSSAGERLRSG